MGRRLPQSRRQSWMRTATRGSRLTLPPGIAGKPATRIAIVAVTSEPGGIDAFGAPGRIDAASRRRIRPGLWDVFAVVPAKAETRATPQATPGAEQFPPLTYPFRLAPEWLKRAQDDGGRKLTPRHATICPRTDGRPPGGTPSGGGSPGRPRNIGPLPSGNGGGSGSPTGGSTATALRRI